MHSSSIQNQKIEQTPDKNWNTNWKLKINKWIPSEIFPQNFSYESISRNHFFFSSTFCPFLQMLTLASQPITTMHIEVRSLGFDWLVGWLKRVLLLFLFTINSFIQQHSFKIEYDFRWQTTFRRSHLPAFPIFVFDLVCNNMNKSRIRPIANSEMPETYFLSPFLPLVLVFHLISKLCAMCAPNISFVYWWTKGAEYKIERKKSFQNGYA